MLDADRYTAPSPFSFQFNVAVTFGELFYTASNVFANVLNTLHIA